MKLRLLVLLKSVKKWVYNAGEGIANAEERFYSNWLRKDDDESNKK